MCGPLSGSRADMAKKAEPTVAAQPELLTASAVARRLGVAVDTLRTWDRRYGVGPSDRATGSRRRYTNEDLGRLQQMRILVAEGMPAAAAASAVTTGGSVSTESASPGRFGGGRTLAVPGGTAEH